MPEIEITHSSSRIKQRSSIEALQESMTDLIERGEIPQTIWDGGTKEGDAQCQHAFGDGVYCRSLLIPAGTCVIGKIHKQDRVVIIAQGRCRFVDEYHEGTVEAPWMGEFRKGSKTAVFAETDTVWVACVATDSKDSRTAFDELTVGDHETYWALLEAREEAE